MSSSIRYGLLIACFLFAVPVFISANIPGKDFLITLNGSKLTGKIKYVSTSEKSAQVSFENDFGDIYTVHPAIIYGFAFEENDEISVYESKYIDKEWQFLKVEKRGRALSLYTSTERQLQFTNYDEAPKVVDEKNTQNWLQFEGEQPFKIYRITFKRVLKKKLESFPELTERLGKKGFRYPNLPLIVELYNKLYDESLKKQT